MFTIHSNWRRSYGILLLATIATVAAADFLFYGHPIGWSTALFAAVFLGVLCARDTRFLTTPGGRIVLLAAFGLMFGLIEQPTSLNVTYTLVCLGILAIINVFGWENDTWQWIVRWGRLLHRGSTRLFLDNGVMMRWLIRRGMPPGLARRVTVWGFPLLFGAVFVIIFAFANPIISQWLSDLLDGLDRLVEKLPDIFNFARMTLWLIFAAWAWMLLRPRLGQRRVAGAVPRVTAARSDRVDVPMAIRCLLVFNVIFAVENILDVRYLWGGVALPAGMTYKEYVHRGFYPLIVAALLAGAFVLITFRPKSETEKSLWARRLVYLWIAQTVFLSIAAMWRLVVYVGMSELTRWRVASTIWMLLVAAGLLLIIWRIVSSRGNGWLVNANAITAAVVLYVCCFINFDGMISHFNVRHCREGGGIGSPLDIEYFRDLGPTTVADLDSIRDKIRLGWRREQAAKVSADLRAELNDDLADWRGWTIRRYRANRSSVPEMTVATSVGPTIPHPKSGG